ncbi:phage tail protein [Trueperella abortisuis]|uniref:phage tail protein n=1 Tax=Trueperella abortisuis TaxID=445930 RepID=UPI0028937B9B|nr:hypothetical protein [Trueperella abortisuis]
MAKHTINVSVLADTKQFRREMKNLGDVSGLNTLKKGIGTVASKLKDLSKWAGAAALALGGIATKAASDLEQSTGTVEDIFKQYAGIVHQNATAAANDVGLSRNAYNELASLISTQLKNGGTALDELAGKSHNLIALGSDLAAGFGGSTKDAVEAISSALKGERDPIEKYGVSLRQASIDAKAAALGFTKVGGSLSDEASQAATLALIMEQTSDMHGKFSRESDTLAHKQEVLKARLENMAATLGAYLIPAASAAVGWISDKVEPALATLSAWIENTVIPAVRQLADKFAADILPKLKDFAAFITSNVIPALSAAVKWIIDNRSTLITMTAAIAGAAAALKGFKIALAAISTYQSAQKAIASFKEANDGLKLSQIALNAVMKANPIMLIVTALGALVAGLIAAYNHNETFRNAVNTAWEAIKGAVGSVVDWFNTYVTPTLAAVWEAIKSGLGLLRDMFTVIWNAVSTAVSTAVNIITAALSPMIGLISGIFSAVSATVSTVWNAAWSFFSTYVKTAWSVVSGIIRGISSFISGIFNTVRALISGNWSGAWNLFKSTVSTAWTNVKTAISSGITSVTSTIRSLPSKILSALGNTGRLLWDAGGKIISGFIDGIKSGFKKVKDTLSNLTSFLPDWKGPAPRDKVILRDSGRLVIAGFIRGLEQQFPAVRRSLGSLTSALPDMIGAGSASLRLGLTPAAAQAAATMAAPVINVYSLNPTAETGRIIARALEEHQRTTGRRS